MTDMDTRQARFETALRDHQKSLARIVATYELRPALQQELNQEILLAIWKALGSFRGDSSLHTFIFRVAHNQAINHVARQVRQPEHEPLVDNIGADKTTPHEQLMHSQRMQLLFKAMHQLPLLQRELLSLSLEGLSYRDIAEITGLTESNVGVRLNRAKSALKEVMEHAHG